MNLPFVFGSGGSARPDRNSVVRCCGITRDSLLTLAADAGYAVEERKIDVESGARACRR